MDDLKNTQAKEESVQKTFTQDEVNAIIEKRLARERKKGEATENPRETELSEKEKELAQREKKLLLKEKTIGRNIPNELIELISFENEEDLDKKLDVLEKYIKKANATIQIKGAVPATSGRTLPGSYDPVKEAFKP